MTRHADIHALLARMEAARRCTQRHLGVIERQIAMRAARMTITARAKRRYRRRSASAWTDADERTYQAHLADLTLARRPELDVLARELARQDAAVTALRNCGGIVPIETFVER